MDVNHKTPDPINAPRTRRGHGIAALTSMAAGKCVPVAVIPMLRQDRLNGSMTISVEMMETRELLMNPVNLRLTAYVVPLLALARFEGSRDQFDRSYMGQPKVVGGAVVPFFETAAYGTYGANAVYKALGLHGKSSDNINTAYLEAYNLIWNFRAKNRSANLTARTRLDATLAPAFWQHGRFENIVPDFDQAVIDGQVVLNLVSGHLPLSAAAAPVVRKANANGWTAKVAGANTDAANGAVSVAGGAGALWNGVSNFSLDPGANLEATLTGITAELSAAGATISLSNIELAKKTQVFAKLREQYQGMTDTWIIDMLMNGLEIPDQALKQPILIADKTVRFSQAKRYATDAANLASSAVSGGAVVDIELHVPELNTGGVVMIIAEAVPEQLFERQRDPFFYASTVADLPDFLRDTLDPEKVDVILNGVIDTEHATPTNTFGYAPMNWKWNAFGPRVGGKFLRPQTDPATDTARQRLWGVEKTNPALAADFYIVSTMHQKPFLDTANDPFELTAVGNCLIDGLTVFGGLLVEPTTPVSNYNTVLAKAPQTRIAK